MIRFTTLAFLVFCGLVFSCQSSDAASPLNDLEKKLHGQWQGQGPCDGALILKADGTYQRKLHGPGGNNSKGTWKLRWSALPPTLTLRCQQSDDADDVGKTSALKVHKLNEKILVIRYVRKPSFGKIKPTVFRRDR